MEMKHQSEIEMHHSMKRAMEKLHQVQLELKVSEISSRDALISNKSGIIQNLKLKLE